jgi:hypothetical protein
MVCGDSVVEHTKAYVHLDRSVVWTHHEFMSSLYIAKAYPARRYNISHSLQHVPSYDSYCTLYGFNRDLLHQEKEKAEPTSPGATSITSHWQSTPGAQGVHLARFQEVD